MNAGQVGGLRAAMYITRRYQTNPPSKTDFLETAGIQIQRIIDQARNAIEPDADESVILSGLDEIRERMTRCGAHIRNPLDIKKAVDDAWALYRQLAAKGRIDNQKKLPLLFKVLNLCLTHAVYLEAIQEYMDQGGKSRGSYLVLDRNGEKPCVAMDDHWRFALTEEDVCANKKILEIRLDDKLRVHKQWVEVRPIPREEAWFEEVWREFREDRIIR